MNQALHHDLTLHRVRLSLPNSANEDQRQQWQRQASQRLERVSVYPALPPQAILIVRQLADPNPGQLLGWGSWSGPRHWERAAQLALNHCWRKALRPAKRYFFHRSSLTPYFVAQIMP